MRAETAFATGVRYHVMSFDITQYHDRLSQNCPRSFRLAWLRWAIAAPRGAEQLRVRPDAMLDYR
jgi:hypothetical protein